MIGGRVYIAPAGTPAPSAEFHDLGVLTEASVEMYGWHGSRTFILTVHEDRRAVLGPSLQELADRREVEELARTSPGAAGW